MQHVALTPASQRLRGGGWSGHARAARACVRALQVLESGAEVLEFALAHVSYNPQIAAAAANHSPPIYNPEAWMLIAFFKDPEEIPSHPVADLVRVCQRFRKKWNELQRTKCQNPVRPGRCEIPGMFWFGYGWDKVAPYCPECGEQPWE